MSEMEQYEFAINKYFTTSTIGKSPLISWDFYAPQFHMLCKHLEDIVSLQQLARINKWAYGADFDVELLEKNRVILITDTKLTIVHASENIISMNGYSPSEIIGKQPKIFQGQKTCRETTNRIRTAIAKKVSFEETLTNYRKDGSTYNCWIKGDPIFNTEGKLVNFIAYEKEVA